MPKLIIDDIPVEVPPGTSVLEAARSVGITIPHFCYHPALAIAAACRLCAVKLLDGPVKGIQMSCSLPAQDGMVVSTNDPEALKLRAMVIEWLMLNHPHDCPVCDEGGECLLQDFTIAGGHSRRRFQGKKRTFMNQYLGETIHHEMNRCIECYRCVRFYQDYAGGTDFGVTGSAGRVYFGRFEEGPLESPFSGNLVDICPTGVFTDRTGRYRARYWDYQFAPSVCQHCSVGCNTSPQNFQREVIKIVARRNDQVNGWFICDRARFEKGYINDPLRPRDPMIDGTVCSYEEAIEAAARRIIDFVGREGADRLAVLGSPRMSLEGNILAAELARLTGSQLCYFTDQGESDESLAATQLLNEKNAAYLRDIEGADCIAILSCDLMEEGPMLALAVRKAFLAGAQVFVVGGRTNPEKVLPFKHAEVGSLDEVPLDGSVKKVIICGTGTRDPDLLSQVASSGAKLVMLQRGPNGFGAAMLALQRKSVSLAELVAGGKVRGVVSFEADIPSGLLGGVPVLACADWRACGTELDQTVFLPTTTWVESNGTAINYEGRAQRFERTRRPGLPLKGLDPKYYANDEEAKHLHPPRVHRKEIPGGAERDVWSVIAHLVERLGGEEIVEPLTGKWKQLKDLDAEGGGIRVFDLK